MNRFMVNKFADIGNGGIFVIREKCEYCKKPFLDSDMVIESELGTFHDEDVNCFNEYVAENFGGGFSRKWRDMKEDYVQWPWSG